MTSMPRLCSFIGKTDFSQLHCRLQRKSGGLVFFLLFLSPGISHSCSPLIFTLYPTHARPRARVSLQSLWVPDFRITAYAWWTAQYCAKKCLSWLSTHLWWSRDTAVRKTLNRWQLWGDASTFFGCSLTSELGTFINADMQLTSFKKHGSRVFSDKIHLPPAIKRNWSVFMKLNVQYNTKMYWPWKLFDYCLIDKKV